MGDGHGLKIGSFCGHGLSRLATAEGKKAAARVGRGDDTGAEGSLGTAASCLVPFHLFVFFISGRCLLFSDLIS